MKIIVDAFGGDNAPLDILKGCEMAVKKYGDVQIVLTGDEATIRKVSKENGISLSKMEIVHAPDVMAMEEHPNQLTKSKKNSSMAVAMRLLSEGGGDGLVGAGSTGAMLVGATLIVKRIKGVKRPALSPIMPGDTTPFMLIDCGANADCRPEMLCQFAQMGSVYMKAVAGVANPRVGLANIGTEETKGDELRKETYKLLSELKNINFVGNVEARDIPFSVCDVVVTDGFTGNIILKMYEGVASALMGKFKQVFKKSLKNKLAAASIMGDLKIMKKDLDYSEYGGAPFIGVKKPVFKAHGSSDAKTFCNAIGQTAEFIRADVIGQIEQSVGVFEKADENAEQGE
ncbi:MAG: phosphate acyltransferase PlsX [Oscillospiraceae bacterium]|jgi:glycerol-3-phosphate acyltransferase PlsX|nr:phosphate acyltransferase PlsX [Oscillospiraceae bacterium]